jgi:hypothetical protein
MLPNLVIIGAMKSGTTSLHHYLNLHPEISMSHPKELDFFCNNNNWQKGIKWYESHFAEAARIRGESSTNYTKFPTFKRVPERMYSTVPNTKIIYLLRDPMERIISHYVENFSTGLEKRPIRRVLMGMADNHYLNCSRYYFQLEQYFKYFDDSNIFIVDSYELRNRRRQTLQQIFRFLGVDDSFNCSEFSELHRQSSNKKRKNLFYHIFNRFLTIFPEGVKSRINHFFPPSIKTSLKRMKRSKVYRPTIDDDLKQGLIKNLQSDVDSLRAYTGMSFSEWSL